MVRLIEEAPNNVLAFEVIDKYDVQDERRLERLFEEKHAQFGRVNILVKTDQADFLHSSWKAFWEDLKYGLANYKKIGHLAVVGNSTMEKNFLKLDSMIFNNKQTDRIEKYFDLDHMGEAWDFVKVA